MIVYKIYIISAWDIKKAQAEACAKNTSSMSPNILQNRTLFRKQHDKAEPVFLPKYDKNTVSAKCSFYLWL